MRALRTTFALLSLVATAALLGGCGGDKEEHAPVACGEGQAAFLVALRAAPGEVALAGEAPISACLVAGAQAGELVDFSETALAVATKLNAAARAAPGGPANLELGYLLGAIARGGADTEGIHTELLRRLTVAARFTPAGEPLPHDFLTTYEKGFAAGRDHG